MSMKELQKQTDANISAKADLIWQIATHLNVSHADRQRANLDVRMSQLRKKLREAGADEEESRRVCWLIAHHHSYGAGEDTDFRILLEADFLVNADEDKLPRESILAARERLFRTGSGRALLDDIFLAKPYII